MRPTRCNEGLTWDEPRYQREHYKVVTDFGAVGWRRGRRLSYAGGD